MDSNRLSNQWTIDIGHSLSEEQIIKILTKARIGSIVKFFSFYYTKFSKKESLELINSISTTPTLPLYRHIRSNIKGLLVKGISDLMKFPDKYMVKLIHYFEENQEDLLIFSHISFPQMFYSFLTKELLEAAYLFIMESFKYDNKILFQHILIGFIDSFPDFIQNILSNYKKYVLEKHSPINSFIHALSESYYFLTNYHDKIFHQCFNEFPEILLKILFKMYFPLHFPTEMSNSFNNPLLLKSNQQLLKIFEYSVAHPQSPITLSLISAMKSENFDSRRQILLNDDLGQTIVYAVISTKEAFMFSNIFKQCDIIKFPTSGNQQIVPKELQNNLCCCFVNYSINSVYDGSQDKSSKSQSQDSENKNNYSEEEMQSFRCALSKLKHVATKNRTTIQYLVNKPQKGEVLKQINSILSTPGLSDYLKEYFAQIDAEQDKIFRDSIIWHSNFQKLISNFESFNFDIIMNLGDHIYRVIESEYLVSTNKEQISVPLLTNKKFLEKYQKNFSQTLKENEEMIIIKETTNMKELSLDVSIQSSIIPNSDSNIMFLMLTSLVTFWSRTNINGLDFSSILHSFLNYERYSLINSKRSGMMKTKFFKSIVSEIRKSVKYNTGRRIIEVIRIVNSVFTSNCDNPIEILQDCLIASGVDDFIVSFLYYIHLLTVFPQFIKDQWMESNRMILAVRDTMFINMMAVSKKLYQYIANFFYDNDLSPLMLK